MRQSRPTVRPGRPGGRSHTPSLLAVYDGPATPGRPLKLLISGHTAVHSELAFLPLAAAQGEGQSLGLLRTSSGYRLRAATFDVFAEGSLADQASRLVIAGKLPKRITTRPAAVLKGFAKSVASAFSDLGELPDEQGRWRTALVLALSGEIAPELAGVQDVDACAGNFVPHSGRLVWQPYVRRLAEMLAEQADKLRRRNPFADDLSLSSAAALLETGNRRMAGLALAQAAGEQAWQVSSRLGEPLCVLGQCGPAAADGDVEVARRVLEAAERGEGGLALLRGMCRDRPHIIPWLLEAGKLVCSADGFVFACSELDRYWSELGLAPGAGAPGVKELKERLGLSRRKAEGLRRLLADRLGDTGGSQAGEGGA